ncbi:MAG: methyl-accepting chemotaxis protein [Potamolinea sp.]
MSNTQNGVSSTPLSSVSSELIETLPPASSAEPTTSIIREKSRFTLWNRWKIGTKATILAMTIGTLPVLGIGTIAYQTANQSQLREITQAKQANATRLSNSINQFLLERYGDMQVLSSLPILVNSKVRQVINIQEKQAVLNRIIEAYKTYESIAIVDLNGNLLFQSQGKPIANIGSQPLFQAALKSNTPLISQPITLTNGDGINIYLAAPIIDSMTGKNIAVVWVCLPVKAIENIIDHYALNGDEYHVIDSSGKFFIANEKAQVGRDAEEDFPGLAQRRTQKKIDSFITIDRIDNAEQLVTYLPVTKAEGLPDLNWDVILAVDTEIAFAPQKQLFLKFTIGIGVTVLLVSAIAVFLANRATRTLRNTTLAVKKLGEGQLNTRLVVEGEDELASLSSDINEMAGQLQALITEKVAEAKYSKLLQDMTMHLRSSLNTEKILGITVIEAREALEADRAIIYQFNGDGSGKIVAESVGLGWSTIQGTVIKQPLPKVDLIKYESGYISTNNNINELGTTTFPQEFLERFQLKADLVAPIMRNHQLWAILCVHQCSQSRVWKPQEIELFSRLATQVGFAIDQASLLEQQQYTTELAQNLNKISSRIRESFNIEEVYEVATTEVRVTLKTDRVVVYLFDENWQGTIVAESVKAPWTKSVGANITDPCFAERFIEKYQQGRVKAIDNIYEAGLTSCYLQQLEPFEVKANLVVPILAYNKLHGLLVTHQCSSTRAWKEWEISFFKQVAVQVGLSLDRLDFLAQIEKARSAAEAKSQEQRIEKEALQYQLLELLSDIEGATQGDLTVRAEVTVGEIGTVADFFNSVIESLRAIVTQVKKAATQVNTSLGENEGAIRQLSLEALQQAEETTRTLDSVEKMTRSIQDVAENASQAATVARKASSSAQAGENTIERSVQSILTLRDTISGMTKKVKHLGESSQQISKVVSMINQIALQTNLLAINAGIEAARAGEEGQGFAVVAKEVGELAARSAAATQEIEAIVENIQQETLSVVEAMEVGTSQVVEGTNLVKDAKQSLSEILEVSQEIDRLVQLISEATVSQTDISLTVSSLMKEIAKVSESTSNSSRQVSESLQQTVAVAQELQESVGAFKVGVEV